jgi:U3 small nucleolar RNA-associated protein 22
VPKLEKLECYKNEIAVDYGNLTNYFVRYIPEILNKALNDRIKLVSVSSPGIQPWKINEVVPETESEAVDFTIGYVLDETLSLAQVEHGPSGNDLQNTKEFRELWGEKAELRRFKDGSITESVVFECDGTLEQRALLVCRMTAFLLSKHFKVNNEQGVVYWSGLGNRFLKPPGIDTFGNSFQPIMNAFVSLSKQLKSLKELPLSISHIQPVSDALRYSSVFIPRPYSKNNKDILTPLELIIIFESSGRWPDDLKAIQNMKKAFFVRISELIESAYVATVCSISTGLGSSLFDAGYIDIRHESGYTFRCRIHHDREEHLVHQAVIEAKKTPGVILDERKREEEIYKEIYHICPNHAHLIGNLCLRFPFMGTTIRLLKRWAACHLLLSTENSCGIPSQVFELIAASIYLNPAPYSSPAAGFVGFVRALYLISNFDWQSDPLILELEPGKLTSELRGQIVDTFESLAKAGSGHISLFIAHEKDLDSSWFKSTKIHIKLVERLKMFCKATLGHLVQRLESGAEHDVAPLFVTPTKGFGAVIHLDCSKLPQYCQNITFEPSVAPKRTSKFINAPTSCDLELAKLSQFNVVSYYLKDLQDIFSDVCMFFYDPYGGDKICIVWKPVGKTLKFKVACGFNAMKVDEESIEINKDAILAEIFRLGTGICLSVSNIY